MARKGLIESNAKKASLVKKYQRKRSELKKKVYNKTISLEERFKSSLELAKLPRNGSAVRVRTRCMLTGRPRAVYSFFGLCRIKLRELALSGDLPGVKKSSW